MSFLEQLATFKFGTLILKSTLDFGLTVLNFLAGGFIINITTRRVYIAKSHRICIKVRRVIYYIAILKMLLMFTGVAVGIN
jgi:hypothetical protein